MAGVGTPHAYALEEHVSKRATWLLGAVAFVALWIIGMIIVIPNLEDTLADAVRGYEAMIAVGAAFDAHHYSLWHPTTTAGVFGAAAVSGSPFQMACGRWHGCPRNEGCSN